VVESGAGEEAAAGRGNEPSRTASIFDARLQSRPSGKLAPNIGNCLDTVTRSMIQVREASELKERLGRLEEAIAPDLNGRLVGPKERLREQT
jgi:hypothetical protein